MLFKQIKIKLNTISAAKLFIAETNALHENIYIEGKCENGDIKMINGKSIVELLQLDLHSVLIIYVEYKNDKNTQKFEQAIESYIIYPENKIVDIQVNKR